MARLQPPARVSTTDRAVNQLQDAVHKTLREVLNFEALAGVTVRGVVLSATAQTIAHGMERQPRGFVVTDKQDAGDVYRTAWNERTITLRTAAGSVRCDLFIW